MERRVRVRFAPSPTGPLHIGGVRTALYNYLFARKNGGDFLLRIEDTDQERFVPGAEDYIIEALGWIGLKFDEGVHVGGPCGPYRQSERKPMYRQYADQLIASGNAYYAFDTPEELEAMREKLKASNLQPQYDAVSRMSMKNSLTLPAEEVERRIAAGEPYVIRIKLPRKEEVRFHDAIRGWVVVHTGQMDDKVLFKSDGMPTYHLANVVDDYLMQITHVIRGEEWLPSAPLHVMLYRYLGWEEVMPVFAHLPLLLKPEGNGKLSKRDGDRLGFPVFPLEWKDPKTGEVSSGYRETGYFPEAVVNMLALLGWHPSDNREVFTMEELIQEFSLERVSKSGAKFDVQKAYWFNHHYLRNMAPSRGAEMLKGELSAKGWNPAPEFLEKVIVLMSEKVNFPKEIIEKGTYFFDKPVKYDESVLAKRWNADAVAVIAEFAGRAESGAGDGAAFFEGLWNELSAEKNIKPTAHLQALRLSLTGEGGGPPLFQIMELLGKPEVISRLQAALKNLPVSNPL